MAIRRYRLQKGTGDIDQGKFSIMQITAFTTERTDLARHLSGFVRAENRYNNGRKGTDG